MRQLTCFAQGPPRTRRATERHQSSTGVGRRSKMFRKRLGTLVATAVAAVLMTAVPAVAAPGEVLILGSTVTGGAGSTLAQKFVAAGKTPVIVDATTWASMTASDFDSYDAIVLGDPTCGSTAPAAAEANASTWSSVVDGNVVIIGTDETYHQAQGGALLMEKAAAFSVAESGKTGAYISLSCYYHGTAPGTAVPLLSGFGNFTATGVGCFNDAHIVATHPALDGLTDATLSNWGCSVHEAFDSWPIGFEVLAIAEGIGSVFTAPDGTVGTPYILARGVEVISDIDLAPETATNDIGTSHEVTATVKTDGAPVVGTTVTFEVVDGPHVGKTGTDDTSSSGEASFSYTGTAAGVDTIEATFVDSLGRTQRSNRVTKTWVAVELCGDGIDNDGDGDIDEGCNEDPDCTTVNADPATLWPVNHKYQLVTLSGATDPDGDTVTLNITGVTQDEALKGLGDGDTAPDAKAGPKSNQVYLRAERSGTGDGRVYRIAFEGSDGEGGTCSGTVAVGVPHDKGKTAVDSGQTVNSFGS